MRALLVPVCVAWFAAGTISLVSAEPASPEAEIRGALTRWTADFNAGRIDKVCDIFAPSLIADVDDVGQRDFAAQCRVLRTALGDSELSLSYALDIKEVLVEGDMAVVRLVWVLTTQIKPTGKVSTSTDQGLDVFGKGSDGSWRIIRYMTYERP
jgi:steroid delta-isomerase